MGKRLDRNNAIVVTVGMELVGRHRDNHKHRCTVTEIVSPTLAQVQHIGGRTVMLSAATLTNRYMLEGQRDRMLVIAPPATPTTQEPTPAQPVGEAEPVEPETTTAMGVELVKAGDWNLYHHQATNEDTARDIDIAKRSGLAQPRAIRRTIEEAIETGEIELLTASEVGGISDPAINPPRAYKIVSTYTSGTGKVCPVAEYHLNELAAYLIVSKLRTTAAIELRRTLVTAFVLLRHGRLAEAHKVATGHAPQPGSRADLELQIATLKQMVADDLIDSKTATTQQALLVSKFTGVDLTKVPQVTFERWNPSTSVIGGLAEGESVVITKPVDDSDCVSAEWIANKVQGASAKAVGMIARAKKIHGDDGAGRDLGVWVPVLVNTREKNQQWKYTKYSVEIILPILNDVVALVRKQANKLTIREAIVAVIDAHNHRTEAAE